MEKLEEIQKNINEETHDKQKIYINLKKDEIILKITQNATHNEVISEIEEKLPKLKNLYQEEKTPIYVTGKNLSNKEMDEIKEKIQEQIDVSINFDSPKELGLHGIKTTFERDLEISETKLYKGSVRCGVRMEFENSILIIGDVNAGSEIIAGGNIVVTGFLKGLAHAGAKGNTKAIISARGIENSQIRIANLVKELNNLPEFTENKEKKQDFAYISNNEIIIE